MKWRFAAEKWNDPTTRRELRAAKTRKFTLKLNGFSSASLSMNGKHAQASFIEELKTDLIVSADGVDLLRARAGNTQDTVGDTGHGVTFNFQDYRAVIARRRLRLADTLSYTNTDQGVIVWSLITQIQAKPNGSYGITQGIGGTTGILRSWNFAAGQYIGKEIQSMSDRENGFDWDISPTKVLNIFYPQRGLTTGVALEYGKSIKSFTRSRNPGNFANDLLLTGANTTIPIERTTAGIATAEEGRWDGTYSYPDISIQQTLTDRADGKIEESSRVNVVYSVELAPGFWKGLAHIGLGDTLLCTFKSGRVQDIGVLLRVLEIGVDISDDAGDKGGETVRLGLGRAT